MLINHVFQVMLIKNISVRSLPRLSGFFVIIIFLLSAGACVSAKHPPPPSENQILVSLFEQGGLIARETPRGVVVYLPSVMFVVGSATLAEESRDKVAYIAKVSSRKNIDQREIALEGHTDSVGSDAANMRLSEARAKSVKALLVEFSLPAERIETAWFGETLPLLPNQHADGSDDPEARAANRRVEFILLNP